MESQNSYGNLRGASLGVMEDASPNPQTPNSPDPLTPNSPSQQIPNSPIALNSPMSPISSILPKSPTTTTEATSTLVPNNIKGKLMEFCGKNKLRLPEFKRLSPQQGNYSTELTWISSESDNSPTFSHTVTGATRKEAEYSAAAALLLQLQDWVNTYKQNELGNLKGDLLSLTTKHLDRFRPPKYVTEATIVTTHPMFVSTLSVADIWTGEEHTTVGNGVGKKVAEKDAASKMMVKLIEILDSTPTDQTGMNYLEKLEFQINAMYPSYTLEFVSAQDNGQPCMLINLILLLRKENLNLILGYGSGVTSDDAKQICAQSVLPHISKIKEFIFPSNDSEIQTEM